MVNQEVVTLEDKMQLLACVARIEASAADNYANIASETDTFKVMQLEVSKYSNFLATVSVAGLARTKADLTIALRLIKSEKKDRRIKTQDFQSVNVEKFLEIIKLSEKIETSKRLMKVSGVIGKVSRKNYDAYIQACKEILYNIPKHEIASMREVLANTISIIRVEYNKRIDVVKKQTKKREELLDIVGEIIDSSESLKSSSEILKADNLRETKMLARKEIYDSYNKISEEESKLPKEEIDLPKEEKGK